ncbi:MAG: leucine-rich repeat domain-containing protein [Oligoflexus sp.]
MLLKQLKLLISLGLVLATFACQQAEEVIDRRDEAPIQLGGPAEADVEGGEADSILRLASPELEITLGLNANRLEWNAIEGAARYDLYISSVDATSLDEATIISGVLSPYTHIKEAQEIFYSYTIVAVDEEPSLNSLPAKLVNDLPTGLIATCLSYQGESRRTMDAILQATQLRDCYQFAQDSENVTSLTLASQELLALEPLQNLPNLENLDLSDNLIRDLNALTGLSKLKSLNLNSNGVLVDLSPLAVLIDLEVLRVSFNAITNLSTIADLVNLTALEAAGNLLENVAVISRFLKLETLSLANNPVQRTEATCPVVSVQAPLAQFCYQGVVVSYEAHIQKMMALHCVGCHANLATVEGVIEWADLANTHIQAGTMPMGRDPLSAVDKMIFAQWLANLPQPPAE